MHIVHRWKLDWLNAVWMCEGCNAMVTMRQLVAWGYGPRAMKDVLPVHLDEAWSRYTTHGIGGYRLTNPHAKPIEWFVEWTGDALGSSVDPLRAVERGADSPQK